LLGYITAGVSIANDPSKQNIASNGIGLIAPTSAPTLAFIDLFDYVANNSSPGPGKAYGMGEQLHLEPTLPSQDGGCQAAGLGPC